MELRPCGGIWSSSSLAMWQTNALGRQRTFRMLIRVPRMLFFLSHRKAWFPLPNAEFQIQIPVNQTLWYRRTTGKWILMMTRLQIVLQLAWTSPATLHKQGRAGNVKWEQETEEIFLWEGNETRNLEVECLLRRKHLQSYNEAVHIARGQKERRYQLDS